MLSCDRFNFKKNILVLCLLLLFSIMLTGCNSSSDTDNKPETQNTEDSLNAKQDGITDEMRLEEYEKRLEDFNREHGTYYTFPENESGQKWLLSLSAEQFDNYLMSLYDGSIEDVEKPMPRSDDVFMGIYVEENTEHSNDSIYQPLG